MAATTCPICGRVVNPKGYISHVRACESRQKNKEIQIQKDKEIQDGIDKMNDVTEPEITEPDIKNSKTSSLGKTIVWAVGVLALVAVGILMLISPKSKESSRKDSTQSPQKRISLRHR